MKQRESAPLAHAMPGQAALQREARLPLNFGSLAPALAVAVAGSAFILAVYFGVLTLVSDWAYALEQFAENRPFIIALTIGFGLQAGLVTYLHRAAHGAASGKVFAASGTTSGAAMLSCCTHYLVNLVPVLGATGLMTFVSEYQVELLWLGVAANLGGIAFMLHRLAGLARMTSHAP